MTNRILIGDCREQLATLPEKSVHCCVTSPPYWALRSYLDADHPDKCYELGCEPTPEEYVANMVDVFRAVWRVLRDDGVLWLNLGDSFCSGGREGHGTRVGPKQQTNRGMCGENDPVRAPQPPGLKPKDLVGIPWLVAKALQQPYYSGHIMRERDRVWLAATIEAEGTICGFTHERKDGKGVRTGVHIAVTNTSMAMLDECNRIWPTSREDHNPHGNGHLGKRETRRWIAHNVTEKKRLLQEIYPYCISKRKQVVLAYNFMAMSDDAKRLARTAQNEQVTKRRHWIVRALSKLNAGHDVDIPTWCIEPPTLYEPGWYLRSDIIWSKPNPMPESVTDRPTKAHEYLFLLAKSARYYYDAEAVKEPCQSGPSDIRKMQEQRPRIGGLTKDVDAPLNAANRDTNIGQKRGVGDPSGRNRRSVWTVATEPFSGAHFATFPRKLIEPCILAGTSARGACPACGKQWERVVEREHVGDNLGKRDDNPRAGIRGSGLARPPQTVAETRTLGFRPACDCDAGDPVPCTVLDPFLGSGTTACVAIEHGRAWVGCELNAEYAEIAERRIAKQRAGLGLFAETGLPAA